ncbi:MAG: metallophosphoesterase [Chloroflexota bacterium]
MRTFVIGDIHGCYAELLDLLEKAGVTRYDHIISLGDIINRGPQSQETLRFFMGEAPRYSCASTRAIIGNHEYKHVRAHQGERPPTLSMLMARWQIGTAYEQAVTFMESLPTYIDLPEAYLAHAYFEPGIALGDQQARVLVGTQGATDYLQQTYSKPWWTLYDGDKPLLVGHKDMSGRQTPFVYRDRVFGLDTGCVYGGRLTGLWLPDFTLVSVAARAPHWQQMQAALTPPQ